MSTNDDLPLPARYGVTTDDCTRLHEKRVKFEDVPTDAGSLVSGEGTLMVYSDGNEGWAEIHTDEHLGPIPLGHHVLALSEDAFRRIEETPEGFLVRGEPGTQDVADQVDQEPTR
ncbi:MAG: hypothetical protein JO069_03835 [Verrucomicrobia bacterium]|nr:hypothetical protein [Verrucomicrobiota bacterium]